MAACGHAFPAVPDVHNGESGAESGCIGDDDPSGAASVVCGGGVGESPHRDAELLGLVGEVGGDAGAGKHDDADRQRIEQAVVALEGSGAAFACPVGLEDDLRNLAIIGPAGGDALGTARAAALSEE